MNLLMISKDAKILEEGSAARARMLGLASIFNSLHIVVVSSAVASKLSAKTAGNLFVYDCTSPFLPLSFVKALFASIKILGKSKKADWHVTSQDPFETGLIAFLAAKIKRARLQLQIHTDFLSPYFTKASMINRLRVFIARKLISRADSIRVVSKRIEASLVSVNLHPKGRVSVLPVFIDVQKITDGKADRDLGQKFQDRKIILLAGRLEREKNFSFALRAFAEFLKIEQEAVLIVAGEGSEKSKLESLARALNIDSSVHFLGFVTDINSLYRSADVLLVTSDYEGYGMNMVEAVLNGCSVVAPDVGVAKEIGARIIGRNMEEAARALKDARRQSASFLDLPDISHYQNKFKATFQ